MYKTAAVVILYNPDSKVLKSIESYIEQVELLFAYDNSENENSLITNELKKNPKIIYVNNNGNLGIAKVLNLAAAKAIELGYDFLLTMDQDSAAPENLVKDLLASLNKLDCVGLISPLHSNIYNTHEKLKNTGISKVDTIMTSGNLLKLEAYKKVGGFNESFFIDYVDIEYCLRLRSNNYNVYRCSNIVLKHNEANIAEKKIFNLKFYPTNNAPFRLYYKTRNLLYLKDIYKNKFSSNLKDEYLCYLKNFIKMLLFENNRLLKIRMILLGIIDYFKRKEGRKF